MSVQVADSSTPGDASAESQLAGTTAIGAGLLAWGAVLFPALVDAGTRAAMPVLFWVAMALYGALFVSQSVLEEGPAGRLLAGALVGLGLGILVLVPQYSLAAVLVVISVVAAAFYLPLRGAVALAVAQSLVVLVVSITLDAGAGFGWIGAVVYGGLQLFAVVLVDALRREEAAREALDAVNAQLRERNDELAQAQGELAQASRAAERLRISRDLHDTVGHQLTALALHLEAAAHLAADSPAAGPVADSRDMARSLLGDVRAVVGRLREEPADLATALNRLAGSVPAPRVDLHLDPQLPPLPADQVEAVVRCVQECVTNAARHAHAEHLTVDVFGEDGEVLVRAVDDGRGATAIREGHGLTGMRERFAQLDGLVTIRSTPGQGFRVVARFPARNPVQTHAPDRA